MQGLSSNPGLCIRFELKYGEGKWEEHGECNTLDGGYQVTENPKEALVRSQLCGSESGLCGEPVEAGICFGFVSFFEKAISLY